MLVGQVYRAERTSGRWDAIVVGSGIGGLAAAALLAKAGRRVLVLERHYVAGGFTHVFRRPGFEWDVGVHYIGGVQREDASLRLLFDDLSEGRLEWAPMDPVYDRVIVGERRFDFVAGREAFLEGLTREFPGERRVIERYLDLVHRASRAAGLFFAERALPPWLGAPLRPLLGWPFRRHSDRTTFDVLDGLGASPELTGVLTAQWGDYGLPPRRSSFAIHAMVARHYLAGGSYPVGGAGRIAATIVPTIEKAGGTVLVSAEVERILVRNGRASGVRLKDGHEVVAPLVVSDAGVANTFGRLLGPEPPAWARARLSAVSPSVGHVCLYLGLNGSARELDLPRTNLWIYPGYDHDANVARYLADRNAPLPAAYVSFPSAKDPDWDRRHPGRATVEVVGFAPYEWFEPWRDAPWRRRGPEYEGLKAQLQERLLDAALRHVPQVGLGRIAHAELSTPLSTRHFAGYARGEIYGLDHTPARFRQPWLRPHTPIAGLFLTGQDIVTDGVAGALAGGVLAASAILRRNVRRQAIERGRKQRSGS